MTEKKPLREQRASLSYIPSGDTSLEPEYSFRSHRQETSRREVYNRRVVRLQASDEVTAYTTYVERRTRRQSESIQSVAYSEVPARTRRQTGVPAPVGQMRAARLAQQHYTASVPTPIPNRRKPTRRWNLIAKILGLFAILLIGIFVANFALTSSTFQVGQVNILGTQNQALVHTIQHIGIQGQNIFLLNVAAITARIEATPLVATASLAKQWPNQVTVTVEERMPVLLWQTKNGTFSVDSQGVVIAAANETTGADQLNTIVDVRNLGKKIQPGYRLNAAEITFGHAIFEQLPKVTDITAFTLRYDDTIPGARGGLYVVVSQDGWVAYLGNANDVNPLDNRLIELQQILNLARQQNLALATIDLRFGLRPVYTLKS
jgi:hypothetical protein